MMMMSLEEIPCRHSTQFLAASLGKPKISVPPTLRDSSSLEAYLAGSENWKLSLAESVIDVTEPIEEQLVIDEKNLHLV
jgi:hypothetical protein